MKSPLGPSFFAFLLASTLPWTATAQVTYSLQHSIPAPSTVGVQRDANFGSSVAVDGGFTAVGATGAANVKVFDSTAGALLYILTSPAPVPGEGFGGSVAISGTRVVVGANAYYSGAGSAYVYDLSSSTPTVAIATLNNPSPAADDIFGAAVAISGTRVVVGANYDDTGASNAGSAYVYDLSGATPTVPVATLNNPGPAADDNFGVSVGISGTRIVVGAFGDDTGAPGAGSAYVYDLTSATPTVPVRTLNNPGPPAFDGFGISVAITGSRMVVGAWRDDSGAGKAGSAYVYELSGGTPTVPVVTLNNPDPGPAEGDLFGSRVAISGMRVVVGVYADDTGATNAGSAYVYDLSSATPTVPVATMNNPGPAYQDHFGSSVAISGTHVVVGAPGDSPGGSAYAYELNGAAPTVPVLTLNNGLTLITGDVFGHSVALSGSRLIVGVPRDKTGADLAGSAYAYDLSSAAPTTPSAVFRNPRPVASDYFGNSVAISGPTLVIGAPGFAASQPGKAYVYDLSSGTPTVPVLSLDNPGLSGSVDFGYSVAVTGTRVVVGVYGDDTGALGAGRAYIYDVTSATPTVPVLALDNPNPGEFDEFGYSVAISNTRVVVGAPLVNNGANDAGRVYVFDLASATPAEPIATLNNPTPTYDDQFGWNVAISGLRVVVGTPFDDTGAIDAGSAYVYDLSSATPRVPIATLNNPSPAAGDLFGISVAIFGTRVVVGAGRDDTGAADAGTAYVYDLSSSTPTVPVATINHPRPAAGDSFGDSVAIDGAMVAMGAPFADTPGADEGMAHVFSSDADGDGLLDGWEIAHFGTIIGHGAAEDSDGDGRNELLEEAFDTNPLAPDAAAAPLPVNEGGFLTMTIPKRPGVNWEVESAGTLRPALTDSFSPATTTVLINNAATLKVRDNVRIGTAAARFIRTRVTAAP